MLCAGAHGCWQWWTNCCFRAKLYFLAWKNMLCIQLLFPTSNLLSAAEASFFLIFHGASFCPGSFLANDPFLLKIAFLKQTNKLVILENMLPMSFWERRAWPCVSQVRTGSSWPLCPQLQKTFYRLARLYSPVKNKQQDKHACCCRVNGVMVSLQKCQQCVYMCIPQRWKSISSKSVDAVTYRRSKQRRPVKVKWTSVLWGVPVQPNN